MTDNSVTSVIASPSLIFQRVRGDDVDDEDDDKSVTPQKERHL